MAKTPYIYSAEFFESKLEGAQQSANAVVPIVLELVNVSSVVDVGCGRGVWLAAFRDHGVVKFQGVDGIEPDLFLLDKKYLQSRNLETLENLDDKYDLAVCLEVAEHLPRDRADQLVRALTDAAPVVLFSAAVPGQGGLCHLNEQWPDYWEKLFANRGFNLVDLIRPLIRDDRCIDWWYRQNIVMFASYEGISCSPRLGAIDGRQSAREFEWVHMNVVHELLESRISKGLRRLRSLSGNALRRAHILKNRRAN
jgi:SAM-dependent methyltransferase